MGLALARGLGVEAARSEIGQEVEGVVTARSIHTLAASVGVEMPISEQVYRVLYEGASPLEATAALLDREPKAEFL
jgi:glycerol-3-phosphate dehydrogenase (NAD(P)+)